MTPYLYEVHLHTAESSRCGRTPAREYVPYYLDRGYTGIVVTDHFCGNPSYVPDRSLPWEQQMDEYCRGWEEALDEGEKRGLKVFFGIEQQFANDECLIYGPDKAFLKAHPAAAGWNRKQWFDAVDAMGGLVVMAHPFRVRDYVKKITLNPCVHGVEVFNRHNTPQADIYGLAYAGYFNYPMTAGTDMHEIGKQDSLYGMAFEEAWQDIFSYATAVRERKTYQLRADPGRGEGEALPLERPYELLNQNEKPVPWKVNELF